jgi:hypothetical protein
LSFELAATDLHLKKRDVMIFPSVKNVEQFAVGADIFRKMAAADRIP